MDLQSSPGECDHHVREVLFVIPTEITHPYFIRLYGACEKGIFHQFGRTLRPVLRSVEQPFDAKSIREVIEREFEMSDKIRALVVAPTEQLAVSEATTEIVHRMSSTRGINVPVVALSLPFHHPEKFSEKGLPIPPMVICDSENSAELLGRRACADFYRKHGSKGEALVLLVNGSNQRRDSRTRVYNFWKGFLDHFNDFIAKGQPNAKGPLRVRRNEFECGWSRSKARLRMKELLSEKRNERFNVAFAANDDMALGLVDAIFGSKKSWTRECLVYGFDGIDEMCHLVSANHPNLKGTVRQDVNGMSKQLIEILKTAIDGSGNLPAVAAVRAEVVRCTDQSQLDDADEQFRWHREVLTYHPNSPDWVSVEDVVAALKRRKGRTMSAETLYQYRLESRGGQLGENGFCGRDKDGRFWQSVENTHGTNTIFYLAASL